MLDRRLQLSNAHSLHCNFHLFASILFVWKAAGISLGGHLPMKSMIVPMSIHTPEPERYNNEFSAAESEVSSPFIDIRTKESWTDKKPRRRPGLHGTWTQAVGGGGGGTSSH